MTEAIRYIGPLVVPEPSSDLVGIHGVSLPNQVSPTAVFNGPLIEVADRGMLLFPRIRTARQNPDVTDIPAFIGVYAVDPDILPAKLIERIPVNILQGSVNRGLLSGALFPEDLRGSVIDSGGTIMFGLTAAGLDGIAHPAILTAKPPYGSEDFSQIKILDELPSMKNVMPLNENTIVGRPEFSLSPNGELNFAHKDPEESKWRIISAIKFPYVPWVGEKGRFGLVGWNERVPVPSRPDVFRLLIHGYKINYEIVEYAIGLSEIQELPDGTFIIIGVDKKPLLTYAATVARVMEKAGKRNGKENGKESNSHKRVIYSVGGIRQEDKIILPVTLFDHEIHLFKIPTSVMLRDFSYN